MNFLPYTVCYKDSLRCAGCPRSIPNEHAAITITADREWHHFYCFFKMLKEKKHKINACMIAGLHTIPPRHQLMLYHYVADFNKSERVPPEPFMGQSVRLDALRFVVAPTDRVVCHSCSGRLEKGTVKIGYNSKFICYTCLFTKVARVYGDVAEFIEKMNGVELTRQQREKFKITQEMDRYRRTPDFCGVGAKRRHDEPVDQRHKKNFDFQEQIEHLWKWRVLYTKMSPAVRREIFLQNDLTVPIDDEEQIAVLSDFSVFGKTRTCPLCEERTPTGGGRLYPNFVTGMYECTAFTSVTEKCPAAFKMPERDLLDIVNYKKLLPEPTMREKLFAKAEPIEANTFDPDHLIAAELLELGNSFSGPDDNLCGVFYLKNNSFVNTMFHQYRQFHTHGKFHAILQKVDVRKNLNSYRMIVLLEHDTEYQYCVFHCWGRVGTTFGGMNAAKYMSKSAAITEFQNLFQLYTQNDWESRPFHQKFGCYSFFETPFEKVSSIPTHGNYQNLEDSVRAMLLHVIDQTGVYQKCLVQTKVEQLPLGLLSEQQVTHGFNILDELLARVAEGGELDDLVSQFYMTIPHYSEFNPLPPLNNEVLLRQKWQWLTSLSSDDRPYVISDHLDRQYQSLSCTIRPLNENEEEYTLIKDVLMQKIGRTHEVGVELAHVFQLTKTHDIDFNDVGNRKLLWHGSKVANVGAIIKNGLRVRPDGPVINGDMFGKGVYFADIFSKSLSYTRTVGAGGERWNYLFLCDVSLGNSRRETIKPYGNQFVAEMANGFDSVHGIGKWGIHVTQAHPDGFEVPVGPLVNQEDPALRQLLYDEYTVYKENQIKLKYLVQVKLTQFRHLH